MAIQSDHYTDANGNPHGGQTKGCGIAIRWQQGSLGRGPDRKEPNGAFVEDVILAARDRLEFYQRTKFASPENLAAICRLEQAINALRGRTARREAQGIEGTHEVGVSSGAKKPARYQHQPIPVVAVHFDGSAESRAALSEMAGHWVDVGGKDPILTLAAYDRAVYIDPDTWVIMFGPGDFRPCEPGIFAMTFEPVAADDDDARNVPPAFAEPALSIRGAIEKARGGPAPTPIRGFA